MYSSNKVYQCPYYVNIPIYNPDNMYNPYMYPCNYHVNTPLYNPNLLNQLPAQYLPPACTPAGEACIKLKDYGSEPFVVNIREAAKQNNNFRLALWTGKHLQLTLMSIKPGEDIGLETHPDLDQFIRIEEGQGIVMMGDRKDKLDLQQRVYDGYAIIIPAGKWHNLINTGCKPIKLYSIYAPPEHPFGTVHATKAIAEAAEHHH